MHLFLQFHYDIPVVVTNILIYITYDGKLEQNDPNESFDIELIDENDDVKISHTNLEVSCEDSPMALRVTHILQDDFFLTKGKKELDGRLETIKK